MTEILQELNWETLAIKRKTTRPPSFEYKVSHNLTDLLVVVYLQRNNDFKKKPVGTTHLSLLFLEQ